MAGAERRTDGGEDKHELWEHPNLCNPPWYTWYQLLFLPSLPSIYFTGINKRALLSPCRGPSVSGAHSALRDPAASAGSCTEEAIGLVSLPTHHCHRWGWHQKAGLRHSQMLSLSGMELVMTGALEGIFQSTWHRADSFCFSCHFQKGLSLAMNSSVCKVWRGQPNCSPYVGCTQPPSTSLGPLQGQRRRCLALAPHIFHSSQSNGPSSSARSPNILKSVG